MNFSVISAWPTVLMFLTRYGLATLNIWYFVYNEIKAPRRLEGDRATADEKAGTGIGRLKINLL